MEETREGERKQSEREMESEGWKEEREWDAGVFWSGNDEF